MTPIHPATLAYARAMIAYDAASDAWSAAYDARGWRCPCAESRDRNNPPPCEVCAPHAAAIDVYRAASAAWRASDCPLAVAVRQSSETERSAALEAAYAAIDAIIATLPPEPAP